MERSYTTLDEAITAAQQIRERCLYAANLLYGLGIDNGREIPTVDDGSPDIPEHDLPVQYRLEMLRLTIEIWHVPPQTGMYAEMFPDCNHDAYEIVWTDARRQSIAENDGATRVWQP